MQNTFFSESFVPSWIEPSTLVLDYDFLPLFLEGIFYDGYADGIYKIKERNMLQLPIGAGRYSLFYIPSNKRYRGKHWAQAVSLDRPSPPRMTRIETVFRLGDRGLSLDEAVTLCKILDILQKGKGAFYSRQDQKWVMPIVWRKIREVLPESRVLPIKDFKQFVGVFWKALNAAGPLPEFRSQSFLQEIYENWDGRISLTPDVVTGLEILAQKK